MALVGENRVYRVLFGRMSMGAKIDRVRDLAKVRITDEALGERVKGFCQGLDPLVRERNRAIHGQYVKMGERGMVIRVTKFSDSAAMEFVTPDMLTSLADKIAAFTSEFTKIGFEVGAHIQAQTTKPTE